MILSFFFFRYIYYCTDAFSVEYKRQKRFSDFISILHVISILEKNNSSKLFSAALQVKHQDLIETVGYEYISYACKQGGPPRVGSGRGIRVNQR